MWTWSFLKSQPPLSAVLEHQPNLLEGKVSTLMCNFALHIARGSCKLGCPVPELSLGMKHYFWGLLWMENLLQVSGAALQATNGNSNCYQELSGHPIRGKYRFCT